MIDYNDYWKRRIEKKQIFVMPRHNEIVKVILAHKRNGSVLDLGCGEGHILNMLKNFDRYGSDITEEPFKFLNKNIKLKICDLNKCFPFEGLFDVIICSEVLEHIRKPDNILNKIHRHIKSDGLILITIPNYKNINKTGGDPTHLQGWKIKEFCKLLEKHGLEIKDYYPTYFKWKSITTSRLDIINSILKLIKSHVFYDWIGEQILFICYPSGKES